MRWNLGFIIFIGLCTFSIAQQKQTTTSTTKVQSAKIQYTCPMHKAIRSDKPGECTQCGMDLIAVNDQHSHSKKKTMEAKADTSIATAKKRDVKALLTKKFELMKEGKYHCCIDGGCMECADEGGCNCARDVQKGRPICDDCYKGWQHGDGMVEGKTLKDIKHEEHKKKDPD